MVQIETEKDVIYFQDNPDYNLFFSVKMKNVCNWSFKMLFFDIIVLNGCIWILTKNECNEM
jgi:hypothetical protein